MEQSIDNITKNINNSIIRKMHIYISKYIDFNDEFFRSYYKIIHTIFMVFVAFIIIFNTNIVFLCCILIIVTIDANSVIFMHGCPLTILEKKYLKNKCKKTDIFKKIGILHNCSHEYEQQLELLINVWCVVACKILLIIFFRTFNIKLQNNNLYSDK